MIKAFKAWRARRAKFRQYERYMPSVLEDLKMVPKPFTNAGLCVICSGLNRHTKDCIWKFANRK